MLENQIVIRQASEANLEGITHLFRETILTINARDYAPEQTNVWSAVWQDRERWLKRIREQYFLLAELNGRLTGFASVDSRGYLDVLYVGKDYQRKGIARTLLKELEAYVLQHQISTIYSDVSITARPFFERHGFTVEKEQRKMINGVEFVNFRMRKDLL